MKHIRPGYQPDKSNLKEPPKVSPKGGSGQTGLLDHSILCDLPKEGYFMLSGEQKEEFTKRGYELIRDKQGRVIEIKEPVEVKEVNAEVLEQGEVTEGIVYSVLVKEPSQIEMMWYSTILHRTKQGALSAIANFEHRESGTKYYLIKIDLRENVKPPATPTPSSGKPLTEAKD